MKRHALIIECSEIAGQDKLPGAKKDADAWADYLLSNQGGAWLSSEITILRNPTPQVTKLNISLMPDGYGFVAFSGHGYVSSHTKETMICLQGGDISETTLIPQSTRATIILDSCRGMHLIESFADASLNTMYKSASDSERFRTLFDSALTSAEKGLCKLYGCAFEQAAQESKAGGYFTQALIQAGKDWAGVGVFSLQDAYKTAEKTVRQRNPQQTPESELGRRLIHFPLAVRP